MATKCSHSLRLLRFAPAGLAATLLSGCAAFGPIPRASEANHAPLESATAPKSQNAGADPAVDRTAGPAPDEPPRTEATSAPASEGTTDPAAEPVGATPESIPQATPTRPIDLASALRLADSQNPSIGEARVLILAALAQRQAAYGLLLPTLNAGTNYRDHVGVVQRSNGTILPVTNQSLYVGGGSFAIGTNSPNVAGVNILSPLTDAIFAPLAAQQRVRAASANASATSNFTLLDVARLYIELVGAQAQFEARRVSAADADEIARSVATFATTGQGRRSDADRADADRRLFQAEILRAEELRAVTSAELSRLLNLDPSGRLEPMSLLEPIVLINPETPVEELIRTALARRPDLANREALVAEAGYQVRREKARPFLPTVWISFSGGAFGGGSNLVPPGLSGFAGRTDFDARAYWTLLNFGAGNAALIRQRRALEGQAVAESLRVINEVREQVTTARAQALALGGRVDVARARLQSAEDGYRQDRARLRETLARPIEALDSLRLLAEARIALVEAITRANQNQFTLFVALGAPPPL